MAQPLHIWVSPRVEVERGSNDRMRMYFDDLHFCWNYGYLKSVFPRRRISTSARETHFASAASSPLHDERFCLLLLNAWRNNMPHLRLRKVNVSPTVVKRSHTDQQGAPSNPVQKASEISTKVTIGRCLPGRTSLRPSAVSKGTS